MHVIEFTEEGKASALQNDAFPLDVLGHRTMKRASTIEWNEERQLWEVFIEGKVVYDHASRADCLDWERCYFNSCILHR